MFFLTGNDKELLQILENKHVRNLINEIDTCDRSEKFERAMKDPIFVEFTDACIRIVEDS